jgi:hypothetical protein
VEFELRAVRSVEFGQNIAVVIVDLSLPGNVHILLRAANLPIEDSITVEFQMA